MLGRPQGVTLPASQLQGDRGEPNTVFHVMPMIPVAVEYSDETGVKHRTVVYKVGKAVYFDSNADRWAANLRPAAPFLAQAVLKEVESAEASIPATDTVSILDESRT